VVKILSILLQTILPVILIAGAGYVIKRRLPLDIRTVSRICLYILTPCLAFSSIADSRMSPEEMWRMATVSALVVLAMVLAGTFTAILLGLERQKRGALQVSLAFSNSGNFGLSVCYFAFGDPGLERAMIYFVTSALLGYSLGVYLASRGGAAATVKASLRNMLTMPILYAALAGLVVNLTQAQVPTAIMRSTELAGRASIPMMLLLLGMQLTQTRLGEHVKLLSIGTFLKLIAAPAIGLAFATILRMEGVAWQVAIVESAMPTAVTNVIITTEFESASDIASGMVLVTTLTSVFTLTLLLALIT